MEELQEEHQQNIKNFMNEIEKKIAGHSTQHTQCRTSGWNILSVEGDEVKIQIRWVEASYGDNEYGSDYYLFNYKTLKGTRCPESTYVKLIIINL